MFSYPLNRVPMTLGLQTCLGGVLVTVPSLAILRPEVATLGRLAVVALCWLAVLVCLREVTHRPQQVRIVGVLVTMFALGVTGLVTDGLASTFSGLYVLVFVYAGLRLSRRQCLLLLPLAAGSWWLTNLPVTAFAAARLPVAMGLWLVVSQLVSRLITQDRELRDALAVQLRTDPLTGLLNRHGLTERVAALRPQDCVVFLDLDHFKRVNDRQGHAAGDAVLSDLGRVVLAVLRPGDTAVRYGGEEVALLLPDCDDVGADRFLERLTQGWLASHPELTLSAGVATVGNDDGASTLARADAALYAAKAAGRNTWRHDSPAEYARRAAAFVAA